MEFRQPKGVTPLPKTIVLFTGLPGVGKTTLMREVAGRMNIGRVHTKDDWMVPLLEQSPPSTFEELVALRKQAYEGLAAAVKEVLAEHRLAFVEANFDRKTHSRWIEELRIATGAVVVQVYCRLPANLAWERFNARQQTKEWPAAHPRRNRKEYFRLFVENISPVLPVYKGQTIEMDMSLPADHDRIIKATRRHY